MKVGSLLALLLLVLAVQPVPGEEVAVVSPSAGEAKSAGKPALPLRPIPVGPAPVWKGKQILEADGKGNTFLLNADTLEVFRMKADGSLGEGEKLQRGAFAGELTTAALSRGGDRWLLVAGNQAFLSKSGGAERLAPPGWLVSAATFIGEEPVLGVLPIGTGGGGKRPKELPLVVGFDGRAWPTLVGNVFKPKALNGRNPMDVLHAEHTVLLLGDSQRKLWVVWPYTYMVRRYTPSGRVAAEFTVGKGEARYRDNQEEMAARFEKEMERKGYDSKNVAGAPFTGIKAVESAAFGRDGNLYLVVGPEAAGGKRALDRFNQVTMQVERTALALEADVEMAAGKAGLYFAAKEGNGGRWFLSWEALEAARWKEVPDLKMSGSEASEAESGR